MKNKSILLLLPIILNACAYDQFGAITEKYGIFGSAPPEFVKSSPDKIGKYNFLGIGKISSSNGNTWSAYYYNPMPIAKKADGGVVMEIYSYTNAPTDKEGIIYQSTSENVYLNCKNFTFGEINTKYYADRVPSKKPVLSKDEGNDFKIKQVNKSNLDYILYKKFCN